MGRSLGASYYVLSLERESIPKSPWSLGASEPPTMSSYYVSEPPIMSSPRSENLYLIALGASEPPIMSSPQSENLYLIALGALEPQSLLLCPPIMSRSLLLCPLVGARIYT